MSKLTKGQCMCLTHLHCNRPFICRLAWQAARMGLKLEYKKQDLDACPAFTQMVKDGIV